MEKLMNILLIMVVSSVRATLTSAEFNKYHYKYHYQNNAPAPSVPPLYSFADECMEKLGDYCGNLIINKSIDPIDVTVSYGCCAKLQEDVGIECYKAIMNATLDEITDISPEDKQKIRDMGDSVVRFCDY